MSELNNQSKLDMDDRLGETRSVFSVLGHKIPVSWVAAKHLQE